MKRMMVAAAALAAGMAIAAPMMAWSADESEPRLAQALPGQPGMAPGGPQGMGPQGFWGHEGHGPMGGPMTGGHPGMMEGMMGRHGWMERGMAQRSPQQRCEERLARRAGMIAYVAAKLNLTAEQRPLGEKVRGILQANADRERQLCATLKPADQRGQETMLDRLNRRAQFLSARLQSIQQEMPALQEFYQALTPEQKAIIDHPFRS